MLRMSASIASHAPVILGDTITGLDDRNIQILVSAILHASARASSRQSDSRPKVQRMIGDQMSITGARWSVEGAQAILQLRAIAASGDLDDYWNHHITRERQRNHLSRYQPAHQLAA